MIECVLQIYIYGCDIIWEIVAYADWRLWERKKNFWRKKMFKKKKHRTWNVAKLPISNTNTYACTVLNPNGCPLFHSAILSVGNFFCENKCIQIFFVKLQGELFIVYYTTYSIIYIFIVYFLTCCGTSSTTSSRIHVSQTKQLLYVFRWVVVIWRMGKSCLKNCCK